MIGWFKSLFKEEQKKDDVFVPPETRIKVITQRNGEIFYIPECYSSTHEHWFEISLRLPGQDRDNHLSIGTLEYSKAKIDYLIKRQIQDWEQRAVKVEYVKYP